MDGPRHVQDLETPIQKRGDRCTVVDRQKRDQYAGVGGSHHMQELVIKAKHCSDHQGRGRITKTHLLCVIDAICDAQQRVLELFHVAILINDLGSGQHERILSDNQILQVALLSRRNKSTTRHIDHKAE